MSKPKSTDNDSQIAADAARYRWIRSLDPKREAFGMFPQIIAKLQVSPEFLDAAIDLAIEDEKNRAPHLKAP